MKGIFKASSLVTMLVMSVLSNTSCRSNNGSVETSDLVKRNGRYFKKGDDIPYSGLAVRHNEDGIVVNRTEFKNGLLDGDSVICYANGNVKRRMLFQDSLSHGLTTSYYRNGTRELEVEFKGGKKHGQGFVWWPNGKLKKLQSYYNDILHGTQFSWYDNGELNSLLHFNADELNGRAKFWYIDGTPHWEGVFVKGNVIPPIKVWSSDGKMRVLDDPDSDCFAEAVLILPKLQKALGL